MTAVFNASSYFIDRHVVEGRADSVAIECGDARVTYRDLYELVNRFGSALRDTLGVRPEERILLLTLDGPEMIYAFFGAIKIGAVPVPINTLWTADDYDYVLRDARPRVLIVSAALLPRLGESPRAAHPWIQHIVVVGGEAEGGIALAALLENASPDLEAEPTSADSVAFWLYSSGSTGRPKACVHLQHDMRVCAEAYAQGVLGIRPADRFFSVAKLFFAYGLGNAGYFPMAVGAQSVLYPGRPTPETVFEILTQHKPTLFYGIPTLYASMLALKDADKRYDLSSLRLCMSAGEALPEELYTRWRERFGVELIDCIGTTEILHCFLSNVPGQSRAGSTGKAVPGYEAIIVDDEGRPVPQGEIGNLRVKGDSTMAYYWNKHDKTKDALFGAWIQTGDKYWQDPDGYFFYAGRADDMLKVGGIWVSPIEVEGTLIKHAAVLEAAVVGREDSDKLVKPHAYVVLKEPEKASPALADEMKTFVKDKIAPYKYPRWIDFVTELPKTATGKIQRFKLRA